MIQRTNYISLLRKWQKQPLIKVVTGIRRCGKSTLLKMFADQLRADGVADRQIIYLNFEDLSNEHLTDYRAMHDYITQRLCNDAYTYIFLDEVQCVRDFQRAVDSLYVRDNVDIYITGSNAYMLSGDLATLLSGRYVEIPMLPFSFAEYRQLDSSVSDDEAFGHYLSTGGFPYVATLADKQMSDAYLEGIYNTIVVKDVEYRQTRKPLQSATDVALIRLLARYLADVTGNLVSVKSIADYLTINGRKVSPHTIADYIDALVEAFVLYPADRYDVSGKELLKTNKKYYIVDTGLRRHLVGKRGYDIGCELENVVYLQLLRLGYKVFVGKVGTKEIDFVAKRGDVTEYYQVSASIVAKETFERETSSLLAVKDNYPKTILTLDRFTEGNYGGIVVKNVVDWLLDK